MNILSATPAVPLHRCRPWAPLNWDQASRHADGDVFSATNTNTGAIVKRLRAQPRKGRHRGLSFVAPSSEDFLALHKFLGGNTACVITPINTPLPGDLRLVHDGPLMLPLYDDKRRVCGEHYTLFTPDERDVQAFE